MTQPMDDLKQPEALRLADVLDKSVLAVCAEAAAELRRLHEANAELLEALKELVAQTDANFFALNHDHVALQNARAAIAAAKEQA